jgi:uncharacterized protein with PIN domain
MTADRGTVKLLCDEMPAGPVTACPACGRVYGSGSHLRRMRARFERRQALRARAIRVGP